MPTVEEVWDDDSDLPLPSSSRAPLPHTGLRGALLEEINDDDLDLGKLGEQGRGEYGADSKAPPPSANKGKLAVRDEPGVVRPTSAPQQPKMDPNTPMGGFMGDMMKMQAAEEARLAKIQSQFGNSQVAQDPSMYKEWNTVYPLYFDSKVSINGGRRVPRKASLWWPQATHIARACSALRIPSVLEPEKTHPADWENPGRVKVQIEKEGRFLNPDITNRTQLYAALAAKMQQLNPALVPALEDMKPIVPTAPKVSKKEVKDAKAKNKGKGKPAKAAEPVRHASKPPRAPQPPPPMDERLPLHSPAAATGIAVSSVKRDIETEKENKKKGIGGPEDGAPKMPKMKRQVVRGPRR